jgi:hypothetical protein
MVQIIVILASSFFILKLLNYFMYLSCSFFLKTKFNLVFKGFLEKYLNKVPREIDWPSFLKLFYIFGHETHLFDNHLYTYLKYTVFRGKIIPVFIN